MEIMKQIWVYIFLFLFCLNKISLNSQEDMVTIHRKLPVDFEGKQILILPPDLRISDSISGSAFIGINVDSLGEIRMHSLSSILIKSELRDKSIINFRFERSKINENLTVESYPLPIRPYVLFFEKKLHEIEWERNNDVENDAFYMVVIFYLE